MDHGSVDPATLGERAKAILRMNDAGGWTKAAPNLYPHQWSWDSAFISIGWAHFDVTRATSEIRSLYRAQWKSGKIPHIVFNPAVPQSKYFPGTDFWQCAALSDEVPPNTDSSGLLQPPVHAIAVWRIWEVAKLNGEQDAAIAHDFLQESFPHLFAWHRYLASSRDPEGTGLIATIHPWEGLDNSPRWDRALARIEAGELEPYERADLKHVQDPSQRPTMEEYDRYLWLVELMKKVHYNDEAIYERHPYLIRDVFMTGIFMAANVALEKIGGVIGAGAEDLSMIRSWIAIGKKGLESAWDEELGIFVDWDVRGNQPIRSLTVAGLGGIIGGRIDPEMLGRQVEVFNSDSFIGHPALRWAVPPSTSLLDPAFDSRRYWRGPSWPFLNWFFWWALKNAGQDEVAVGLRRASLDQVAAAGFAEYIEPLTGEGLGSSDQSWTASVVLDWLASES